MTRWLLVTGGGGLVAQHVAEAAMERGFAVRLADLAWPNPGWAPAAERLAFDIRDRAGVARAVEGCVAVVHCAAVVGPERARRDPLAAIAINVDATAALLDAAHHHGARLLVMSTATLYGHRDDLQPLDEAGPTSPLGIYDATKLMAETYCTAHRRTYGSDVASFRTGFVYGRGTAIGEYFLPRVLRGEAVAEPAGADHPCDFTYVVDLAEALLAAVEVPSLPEPVYNVTGGRLRTRGELADIVRGLLPEARITQGPGRDPGRHLRGPCRIDRATRDFGWRPRFDLETGMADWLQRERGE